MASANKALMLKVGLLSTSITMGASMAIVPALPDIMSSFPEKTTTQVEALTTVQSFTGLIFVLLCPIIASFLSKKRTVMLGLLVAGISGIIPVFAGMLSDTGMDNILVFRIVWFSRLAFGAGMGLVCGLAVPMIGDFFEGDERATLLGVRTSMETLGQVTTTALAGVLIGFGWRWPFVVYAVIFVLLALFTVGVPADEPTAGHGASRDSTSGSRSVPAAVIVICVINFLFTTCYCGINVRISSIMAEGGFGTASESSLVISVLAICGLLSGLAFGKVFEAVHGKAPALGAGLLALGCLLGGIANSLPMMFACGILCGLSYPLFISYLMNLLTEIAPKNSVVLCSSLTVSSGFLAGFFSPYILSWVGNIAGEAAAAPFVPYAILMAGIAVICFFLYGRKQ